MELNGVENERNTEVIFIVPLGLDQKIFPWGVNCIKDYLDRTVQSISTKLWDMREDKYYMKAVVEHSDILTKLFLSLKLDQMETFFSFSQEPYTFLGAVAYSGGEFYRLAGVKKILGPKSSRRLEKLRIETESHITKKIEGYLKQKKNVSRIWAISVYDSTLFNSLLTARLIKKIDPESIVILGGDHFDFEIAESIIKDISFVDGVIVGYGEEVFRRIIVENLQGYAFDSLKIQGLVNRGGLGNDGIDDELRQPLTPPFYHELSSKPSFSYIKQLWPGAYRILTQRGCTWGKCSFCTQFDKQNPFEVSVDYLINEIDNAIKQSGTNNIQISFDSEEVSLEFLIPFLKLVKIYEEQEVNFSLRLWFQVKSFRKELVNELLKFSSEKVNFNFAMNFESLNFETLKNMRKGHTPLKAIESAKALLDSGHFFSSNYFNYFPLENAENIEEEVNTLEKIVHLFMPPKGGLQVFSYEANKRDEPSNNSEKYKIKVKSFANDNWLKRAFGIDLPFSIWSYKYKPRLSFNINSILSYIYKRTMYNSRMVYAPRACIKNFWGNKRIPLSENVSFVIRKAKADIWNSLMNCTSIFKQGKVYRKRNVFFSYMQGIKEKDNNLGYSHLYIRGNSLIKEYNMPGNDDKWSINLNDIELKMFRFLYWSRKRSDVIAMFESFVSKSEIENLIEKHIKLGTIVTFRDSILSTANDPEYWKISEAELNNPIGICKVN